MAGITLNQYIQSVQRMFRSGQGEGLARLLSLKDEHTSKNLVSNDTAALIETNFAEFVSYMNCSTPLDEIVAYHLACVKALISNKYSEAFANQTSCVAAVVRLLQAQKEENWSLPLLYTVCRDLRLVAQKVEANTPQSNGKILEKAAESLLICFRVCAADNRTAEDDTKRHGMLPLVNQLLKVYFRINKLHLCKPLIRAIESSPLKNMYSLAQQITYKFFNGKKAMFDSDYTSANHYLSFAFEKCHQDCIKNKRLILIYLIPVKMLLGYMPKKSLLEKYDLMLFWDLVTSVKSGSVKGIDKVMEEHESFLIKAGIFLVVEKLKTIAHRNLFRRVYLLENTHQIEIASFEAALQIMGEEDVDEAETQCYVASLIYEGKIKGYISYQHKKLVVSKQNAFPPLNSL
ncbi:PCI domain-containing protein 2 [Epargyreus clarus]|uniref:PCI domain-containing protein 2 n=1 Tax=Epargyreus clarus TaxID=520877 RepID=UPI003C2DFE40